MNDAPDWSNIPPPEFDNRGGPASSGPGGGGRNAPPQMTPAQLRDATADFYDWLENPATLQQLRVVLPDHVDPAVFVATAKTAVLLKPQLLREDLRQSLLTGVMRAAGMGLLPDGKQGALVPRYDTDTRKYQVAWQPMVWGIVKLGRETGEIRSIRAVLVFYGEKFRIIQGEEDRIEHEVDPELVDAAYAALNVGRDGKGNPLSRPDEFIKHLRAAYCLITATDGTVTRRWMTRQRLISLRESTKAENGPWAGRWIDEMFLKGMILFTAKWINLDTTSAAAKRFQAAMMADMEIDFDRDNQAPLISTEESGTPEPPRLAAPGDKMGTLEDLLAARARERVARTEPASLRHPGQAKPRPTAQPRVNTPTTAQPRANTPAAQPEGADDPAEPPFLTRVAEALTVDGGVGYKWMRTLEAATRTCPTMTGLVALHALPSVVSNLKNAPASVRSQIDTLFREAADRLALAEDAEQAA